MDSIAKYADELPTGGVTIGALRALDWVAPGQWDNIVGFDNLIQAATGETDPGLLSQVRQRSLELWDDPSQGYQRALWIYQAVDSTDRKLGTLSLAHQAGERFSILGFLSKITPKQDTTQTIDLTVKLVAELAAFCYVNGLPGDSIGDFVAALNSYEKESQIRMAALICFDGLVPLGPEWFDKASSTIQRFTPSDLEGNDTYRAISSMIPGASSLEHLGFIGQSFGAVSGWIQDFVSSRGITFDGVIENLKQRVDGLDGKLDFLGGFLDLYTNYFEHTGTQSLVRSLANRAISEV